MEDGGVTYPYTIKKAYIGLREWSTGKVVESWQDVAPDGSLTGSWYDYPAVTKSQRPFPGSVYLFTIPEEGKYNHAGVNGPKYVGLLEESVAAEVGVLHRNAETLKSLAARKEKDKREGVDMGKLTLEQFRASYRKTNYQTRRVMLAQILEYLDR